MTLAALLFPRQTAKRTWEKAREIVIRWRFRKMTAHFDRMIAAARRRHMPVNHIIQAKRDFVHDCLRGKA